MDYLKEFLNLEEYETYRDSEDFALPNVSLVNNPYSVKYTPYTPPNYFRITNLINDDAEIYFDAVRSSSYPQDESYPITLEYCVNGDGVWTSITDDEQITIPIPANGYVELRGDNISMCNYRDDDDTYLYWNLSVDYNHALSGDIMSICDFRTYLEDYHFYHFIENNETLMDASNLILSATTLAYRCYHSMFQGCTSLTAAPELPATTLDDHCYWNMFMNCTHLTSVPELPATTLAYSCYRDMFHNCTNIEKAPILPATTLVNNCYSDMFNGCTSLNYIKAMFTTTPSNTYTSNWVSGVASTGTFIKSPAATWDVTGVNGVPTGWDVEVMGDGYFTTVAREDGTISFNILKSMDLQYIENIYYSTDNGETWNKTENTEEKTENLVITVNVNKDDKILWKGSASQFGDWYINDNEGIDDLVGSFFSSTCEFDAQGNIMSLLYGDNFKGQTTLRYTYTFAALFYDALGNTNCKIVNAENLLLPATILTAHCYHSMFLNCENLITVPILSATTLAQECYECMFEGCTSLKTAPQLPATTLVPSCYYRMFYGCTSLTVAPELLATTLENDCYKGMFSGCTNLNYIKAMFTTTPTILYTDYWVRDVAVNGTFVKNSAATWNVTGNNGIPKGWTVQTASE